MNKFLTAACLAWTFHAAAADKPKTPPTRQEIRMMEWSGQNTKSGEPEALIIKSQKEWIALWARIGSPPPEVDWTKNFAAAVLLDQKPTGGYKILFLEPRIDKKASTMIIRYRVSEPTGMAIMMLTRPYAVKLFSSTVLRPSIEAAPK